ncbi:MAG: carbon-nitrogen hydrolase family protein, partial [Campylobacter sp.]|nr:carbon-nitrogen hydrolase family protein [Campylobacter sp.]
MSELKLCALQLGTLALSNSRLDYYLQTAAKSGAKVVLLGEYVINSFFAELELMPKSMIKEQSESKKKALAEL